MIMIMTDDLCCGSFSDVLINSSSECFVDQDGGGGGGGGGYVFLLSCGSWEE